MSSSQAIPLPTPNQGFADCIIHRSATCCSQHLVVSWDGFAPILSGFDAPKFRVVVKLGKLKPSAA